MQTRTRHASNTRNVQTLLLHWPPSPLLSPHIFTIYSPKHPPRIGNKSSTCRESLETCPRNSRKIRGNSRRGDHLPSTPKKEKDHEIELIRRISPTWLKHWKGKAKEERRRQSNEVFGRGKWEKEREATEKKNRREGKRVRSGAEATRGIAFYLVESI